jgi:hypothetical protein
MIELTTELMIRETALNTYYNTIDWTNFRHYHTLDCRLLLSSVRHLLKDAVSIISIHRFNRALMRIIVESRAIIR